MEFTLFDAYCTYLLVMLYRVKRRIRMVLLIVSLLALQRLLKS